MGTEEWIHFLNRKRRETRARVTASCMREKSYKEGEGKFGQDIAHWSPIRKRGKLTGQLKRSEARLCGKRKSLWVCLDLVIEIL